MIEWKRFVEAVKDELLKASINNDVITSISEEFRNLINGDVIKNYLLLQQTAQKAKDRYHGLFTNAIKECSQKYAEIETLALCLIDEIKALPENLNTKAMDKAISLFDYSSARKISRVEIEFDVKDKNSRFTFSEVLSLLSYMAVKRRKLI